MARDSQDLCDHVANHVRQLLSDEERRTLGQFYFGLTDEPLISASIERVGDSFLAVIHRRLFNSLQFISDVIPSLSLSDGEKRHLLIQYLYTIARSSDDLTPLPVAPEHRVPHESLCAISLNCSLVQYVLCHELSHAIRPIPSPIAATIAPQLYSSLSLDIHNGWFEELYADLSGVLLPLREERLDGHLRQLYISSSLTAPFIFLYFLGLVESFREMVAADHPPGIVRARLLRDNLSRAIPQYAEQVSEVYTDARNAFAVTASTAPDPTT